MVTSPPHPLKASRSTAFIKHCAVISNKFSGSLKCISKCNYTCINTKSGSNKDSQIPYKFALAVPATTKSLAKLMHPIKSIEQIKGFFSLSSRPAITGSIKNGPKLGF